MSFYPELAKLSVLEFTLVFISFLSLKTIIICGGLVQLYKIFGPSRAINRKPARPEEIKEEFASTIRSMAIEVVLMVICFYSGIIQHHQATHSRNLGTFVFIFFFFELWFYFTHKLMHTKTFYRFHRQHHSSTVITPWSASNFSIEEKILLYIGAYIIPMFLTRYFPITFEGIIIYNTYNFFSNAVGHSNLELGGKMLIWGPFKYLITTSTFHNLHHRYPNKNFGLFLTSWDYLFKTDSENYEEVFNETINHQ